MVFGWILEHKIASKNNKKTIENLIVFLVAILRDNGLQPISNGVSQGAGEG